MGAYPRPAGRSNTNTDPGAYGVMADSDILAEAVRATDGGITIELMVTPNASNPGLAGINPWRKRVEVRVSAEAKKGRANEEVASLIAGALGVPPGSVSIVRGARSHEKTAAAEGVSKESAVIMLLKAIGGD